MCLVGSSSEFITQNAAPAPDRDKNVTFHSNCKTLFLFLTCMLLCDPPPARGYNQPLNTVEFLLWDSHSEERVTTERVTEIYRSAVRFEGT